MRSFVSMEMLGTEKSNQKPLYFDVDLTLFQAKRTPLHLGAQSGQLDVCETLLKMKADANATDEVCLIKCLVYD